LQLHRRLSKRERAILELRFGLENEGPLTLPEIGIRLGVTRECVRKIQLRAIRKLDTDSID
jgi:RNA polymerase primary sigma factor